MTAARVDAARAEIARRRELAKAANTDEARRPWGDLRIEPVPPAEWGVLIDGYLGGPVGAHCAGNDPAHVLAVLDAAEATLDRHEEDTAPDIRDGYCAVCTSPLAVRWPCPDAAAVLDLYAPGGAT